MNGQQLATQLAAGCDSMDLELSQLQQEQLLAYLDLLQRWNRVYNLTAVSDPEQMVTRHLLDSLALIPHLGSGRLLDVGCGAGLPGIPLAIAMARLEVVLVDSAIKKIRFVRQAILELGLANAVAEQARIEAFQAPQFDWITARAFAALEKLCDVSEHLLKPEGQWLAMKGRLPIEEIDQLEGRAVDVRTLSIPGEGAARHLISIRRVREGQ